MITERRRNYEVKNAIDDYVKIKDLKLEVIENRFAKIIV